MKVREKDVLKSCREWLAVHGVVVWRINQQGVPLHDGSERYRKGPHRGIADLLGILPGGRFLAVEVKAPGGRVKPEQWQFIRDVQHFGGVGVVTHGIDELEEQLRPYLNGRLVE